LTNISSDIQGQINSTNTNISTTNGAVSNILNGTTSHTSIKVGDKILTQTLLSYLTNISSDIQGQINSTNTNISTTNGAVSNILNGTTSHTSIKVGDKTLTQTLLSYLTNISSDIQGQINSTNTNISTTNGAVSNILNGTTSHTSIKVGDKTLTQTLLSYLTNVSSDIQGQFTNVTTAISTSITNLLGSENTFTAKNTFNQHLRLGDKLFFGNNNDNFIGFTTKEVNNYKFTLSGVDHTAIGYYTNEQQLVVDSNGIKVNTGTVNANSLTLGTNILSSDLLFFLNKLYQNMFYNPTTQLVNFNNTLLIGGISRGQNVTIDNGNILIEGNAASGITIVGTKIDSTLWAKLAGIFSSDNTYTGYNTFNRLTSITSAGQGPYLRTQQYFVNTFRVFTQDELSINQMIILTQNYSTNYPGIELPNPDSCQGQTINILNYSGKLLIISMTGDGKFTGKNTNNTFIIRNKDVLILQSNFYDWIILSSPEILSGQHLNTKTFGGPYDDLNTTSINNNNGAVTIFSKQYTPKSNNSTIYVSFDCKYSVSGGNSDTINSFITLQSSDNNIFSIANKKANFGVGSFERQSNKVLFPLSGISRADPYNRSYVTIRIILDLGNSDDTVTIDDNFWNLIITETEI
jgi:DNA-binding protein YbaB